MIRGVGTFALAMKHSHFKDGLAVYLAQITLERARLTCLAIEPCAAELTEVRHGTFWLLDSRRPLPLQGGLSWEFRDPKPRTLLVTPAVPVMIKLRATKRGVRPPCVVAWFDPLAERWD